MNSLIFNNIWTLYAWVIDSIRRHFLKCNIKIFSLFQWRKVKCLKTFFVMQIIIDDCGACKEPESLVPIILFKRVKQVVLVGDHKQLCPIVHNATARSLGLERSLLERYSESAIMLTGQYRMVRNFYEFKCLCLHYTRCQL